MKTEIKSELILASKNAATGDILYTFRLTYPRIILAEFNTHRVFSRNTSSSRAIPGKKIRHQVLNDPFIPVYLGRKQKGMSAGVEITGWRRNLIRLVWAAARYPAVAASWAMEKIGVAKQIANRVLEPWMWVQQIASTTDINNFLKLRTHKDAEPHFQELAKQIEELVMETHDDFAYLVTAGKTRYTSHDSKVQILKPGEWHLPLVNTSDVMVISLEHKKLVSAARCARTSYTLIEDGKMPLVSKDIELGTKLVSADPIHASPLEHQAVAMRADSKKNRWGNFRGWKQFRYDIPGERGGDAL
jgi:hypothetical protein